MSELAGRRVEGIVARVAKLVLSYLSSPVLAALRCERDVLQHQRAVILCGHPWDGSGRSLRLSKAWVPSPSASKKIGRSAAHGASAEVAPALPMLTWYPASIGGGGVGSPARGVRVCVRTCPLAPTRVSRSFDNLPGAARAGAGAPHGPGRADVDDSGGPGWPREFISFAKRTVKG